MTNLKIFRCLQTLALMCAVCIVLPSCSLNTNPDITKDAGTFSAVTVGNPSFKPKVGDSFAWYSEVFVDDELSETKINNEEKMIIAKHISDSIVESGYTIAPDTHNAAYLISAMIVMGDRNIQKVAPFFKAYPQVAKSVNHYEDGTLLVSISQLTDTSVSIMWEGAIQAYVIGDDLTDEQRAKRLEHIIKRLMTTLP